MSANPIPLLVSAQLANVSANPSTSDAQVAVSTGTRPKNTGDNKSWNAPSATTGATVYWAFDRTDPLSGPVYTGSSTSNEATPSGIDTYLTTDYLLVVCSQTWNTSAVAQGAQFDLLKQNGAGPALDKIVAQTTFFACGFSSNFVYQLVSIPGSGTPGLEREQIPLYSTIWADTGTPVCERGPFTLTVNLIPTESNDKTYYTPVAF